MLVTTEKDWVKLAPLPGIRDGALPVCRVDVRIRFRADDEKRLLSEVMNALAAHSTRP